MLEFKLSGRSFAYPLHVRSSFEDHDPAADITSAMTNLQSDEMIVVQLVLSPARVRSAEAIARRLLRNDEYMDQLGRSRRKSVARTLLGGISSAMFAISDTIGEIHHGPSHYGRSTKQSIMQHRQHAALGINPARSISPLEQKLADSVHYKLSQPLYKATIRSMILSNDASKRQSKANDMRKALSSFKTNYQSLQAKFNLLSPQTAQYRLFMFKHRMPALFEKQKCILSPSELGGLYHFTHSQSARTENVVKSLSRTLAAPLAVKNNADRSSFDVVIGRNYHLGRNTDIGLVVSERERHLCIIGGTGNGKTTMLLYMLVQDMRSGKGLAAIDPHGDMAEALLTYVPPERKKDVIYFNPDDIAYNIGLNLLELPEGLTGDELLREKDLITETVVSMFRKIFSDEDTGGHRIEYVLRNTIQTALTIPNATLFTVYNLLNDADYRKDILKTLEDKNLKNFWKNELG